MRGPLPLSDADLATVRAEVLRRLERPRRAPVAEWVALAASIVVAVLSIVAARVPAAAPSRDAHHVIPTLSVAKGRDLVGQVALPTPAQLPPLHYAKGRDDEGHKRPKRPAAIAVARMEIHTADPDVRIIWITN